MTKFRATSLLHSPYFFVFVENFNQVIREFGFCCGHLIWFDAFSLTTAMLFEKFIVMISSFSLVKEAL